MWKRRVFNDKQRTYLHDVFLSSLVGKTSLFQCKNNNCLYLTDGHDKGLEFMTPVLIQPSLQLSYSENNIPV